MERWKQNFWMFNTGPLFEANYNCTAEIVINQGGTDSGKTYSLIQLLFTIGCTKAPPQDPIITVLSESVPNAKKGAWRVAQSFYQNNPILRSYIKDCNEGDRIFYFKTGWIMEFRPAIDEQDAKQGRRQYLYVNEADGVPWAIFWQLAKRTRIRTYIDYNPTAPFWAHDNLIMGMPEEESSIRYNYSRANDLDAVVCRIISDHRHNVFITDRDHEKTENIKDKQLWRVYARGLTGNLQGIIYPNWKMIADSEFPNEDGKFGALDFGYTNDPTAGVKMVRVANTIFVHELCYQPGMTPTQLKSLYLGQAGFEQHITPVYCEHDGDMIRQLRKLGVKAIPARKGPNSINPGISKVNEYQICFTASSKNIEFERKRYMWMKDRDTGRFINVPTEIDNHLMDAIRYGVFTHFYRAA